MAIYYFDRLSNQVKEEKIYGGFFLKQLYKRSHFMGLLRHLFCRLPIFSHFYGYLQKSTFSGKKVAPFIEDYGIDSSEFELSIDAFASFNDFFIRKLKPECRPIVEDANLVAMPADARYLVFPNFYESSGIWVKGKTFSLLELLGGDAELAKKYEWGSVVIARLAPVDYHRFHFPCSCTPGKPKLINGPLFSVNPIALRENINYLSENKRVITMLDTDDFGEVAYIEVGATHVGSIHQTFTPGRHYEKGDEKGFFSFGGSCIILLFEPGRIIFAQDLIEHSKEEVETRALMGQLLAIQI
jgi:phosphatidylserine decarboxylase